MGDDLAMLILFGSYARGDWVEDRYTEGHITYTYQSDFDILIVTEKRSQATQRAASRLTDAIRRRLPGTGRFGTKPNFIVEDIGHFNKELERGSYFFTDIKKEGVLLYDSRRHKLARRRKLDPRERQEYARRDFLLWSKSAREFMESAEVNFGKRRWNLAAFELHQATERFYFATILVFTGYKPKTHDLERLGGQVSNLHPDFFTVFPLATDDQKRRFDLLKRAYIDARYKRDYKITKAELTYLIARVRKLHGLTKRICRATIAATA